ncbi:MAG: fructose-bisphosphatase class II, partial [Actinobacteria bacterium]|nr:fructose-bisphosphatase class II family protein [Actinomycetota bacterium]NIU68839.1 fructose-bisphosphatase class II family protein [Actinomycetota bacterium]NIV88918.1 fructose-bisphosphatase class II [Actinomycetota bacterium]NIW30688.1 fructose-bisphosphatase class II [Actinomycetota bacterium]NIX23096.1 fructose-bisphosphatase class II [Actinomycetota bacterium]
VSTACAVKALRGEILGRLWPRDDAERDAALDAGYDLDQVLTTEDLISTEDAFFACTGITAGQLVDGVIYDPHGAITESLVLRAMSGTVRVIRSRHRAAKLSEYVDG